MSTSDLVLQFDDPLVSRDGRCPEDLNHSKPFGGAEGIAAAILDLGKDPAKHDLAGVVVPAVGAVLGRSCHNGVSSFGVVGLGIIAQPKSFWLNLRLVRRYICTTQVSTKKDPLSGALVFINPRKIVRLMFLWDALRFGNLCSFNP